MFFTYSAHSAACAAGIAALRILDDEDLVAASATKGADLMDRLSGVAGHPHVAEVRGLGLMVGVELQQADGEPYPASEGMGARVVAEALERGVWVYPAGDGNVPDALLIGPPFTISDDEMDEVVLVVSESISAVCGACRDSPPGAPRHLLPAIRAHGPRRFAVGLLAGQFLALVVQFAAPGQGHLDLCVPTGEVEPQRHQGEAFQGHPLVDSANLPAVEQKFARPVRIMARSLCPTHGIRRHVHPDQPQLAILLATERLADLDVGASDRLHLAALQYQPGFPPVE